MKRLRTLNSFQIFKIKIKTSKTYSGDVLFKAHPEKKVAFSMKFGVKHRLFLPRKFPLRRWELSLWWSCWMLWESPPRVAKTTQYISKILLWFYLYLVFKQRAEKHHACLRCWHFYLYSFKNLSEQEGFLRCLIA